MTEKVTKSIIVQGEPGELFNMWANFENFPNFMENIKSVRKTSSDTSHWVMEGPMGMDIEWDARVTTLDKNKRIAWNSFEGDIKTSGQVTFNGLPHGETEITATVQYIAPGGAVGEAVAKLFENPKEKLTQDLQNFKEYVEGDHSSNV